MESKELHYLTFEQLDNADIALSNVDNTIKKALALNRAVLDQYLPDQCLTRDDEALLCYTYDTWKTLLECAFDLLDDARIMLKTARDTLSTSTK